MDYKTLQEFEVKLLHRRLWHLRHNRDAPSLDGPAGNAFFDLMEDHWTFVAALTDIYALQEMSDLTREEKVAATLPNSEEGWRVANEELQQQIDEEFAIFCSELDSIESYAEDEAFLREVLGP